MWNYMYYQVDSKQRKSIPNFFVWYKKKHDENHLIFKYRKYNEDEFTMSQLNCPTNCCIVFGFVFFLNIVFLYLLLHLASFQVLAAFYILWIIKFFIKLYLLDYLLIDYVQYLLWKAFCFSYIRLLFALYILVT